MGEKGRRGDYLIESERETQRERDRDSKRKK